MTTLGLDIGSTSVHAALLDEQGAVLWSATRPNGGRPLPALAELLDELPVRDGLAKVAVTGSGRYLVSLRLPSAQAVNPVIATARGGGWLEPDARGVVEIGGHMSRWISLQSGGAGDMEDFALSELCAAGAGVFLEQQAGRLDLSVADLGLIAAAAPRGASVAGRCTVFAKSDMIHLQQKGTPVEEIAYGLCQALARNYQSSVLRGRELHPPVVMVGGGTANTGLIRALHDILGLEAGDLRIPRRAAQAGAIGAALVATGATTDLAAFLVDLAAEKGGGHEVSRFPALPDPGTPASGPEPDGTGVDGAVILGVDVGSVSTNLVLVSLEGELLDALYLATRGRPLVVLEEGLALLKDHHSDGLDIVGVCTTGSGRHLAGRFLGADLVRNEITAQLRGAAESLPEIDTVFEIGGQDSKYISAKDGHILDFTMNKVCAAGTGSFLEEQADRLGISIIGEFADLALQATAPVDLGSRCTVFMDTELAHALRAGVAVPDLTAGLALSVARNYLEKVVAGRPVGEKVLFQGGTASNRAVVAAFRQLLGRPVMVHPHNRVSGAYGAALLLLDARRAGEIPEETTFRGIDNCHGEVERSFECRKCSNRCQVTRFRAGGEVFFFGDVCELYSARGGKGPGGTRADHPLAQRQQWLYEAAGVDPDLVDKDIDPDRVVGIPRSSTAFALLPVWTELIRAAGKQPVLSAPSSSSVLSEGQRLMRVDTCLPVKLAHGHVQELRERGVRDILSPAVSGLPRTHRDDGTLDTCPYTHHLPWMVQAALGTDAVRLITPEVNLGASGRERIANAGQIGRQLGLSEDQVHGAIDRGLRAITEWSAKVRLLASEALDRKEQDRILVVIGRSYNLGDAFLNMDVGRHLARLGIPVVPMDALPLHEVELDARFRDLRWASNRDYVRAALLIQRDPRLFPVVLSSFGCAPDGFTLKHLEILLGDRPRLFLELDEHRAEAGFVTRLEAFADEIDAHMRRAQLPVTDKSPRRVHHKSPTRVVLPYFGDQAYAFYGALRRSGHDVVLLDAPDEVSRHEGEAMASGRECHPYVLLSGDLVKTVKNGQVRPGDRYFYPGGLSSCVFSQYSDGMRHVLHRLGAEGIEVMAADGSEFRQDLGMRSVVHLYHGVVAIDLLVRASCETRPYEAEKGVTARVHAENIRRIADAVEAGDVMPALAEGMARYRTIPRTGEARRPRIGVAGDIYTRVNDFASGGLFQRLEDLGCEVWPAPYLRDNLDFGLDKALRESVESRELRHLLVAGAFASLKTWSSWRVHRALPEWAAHYREPDFDEVSALAERYVGKTADGVLKLNIAKMVDFARGGASGVVNAICFGCMLGGASGSVVERIREDHDGIPMATLSYGGTDGSDGSARLEAFVYQVHRFHERRLAAGWAPEPRVSRGGWWSRR